MPAPWSSRRTKSAPPRFTTPHRAGKQSASGWCSRKKTKQTKRTQTWSALTGSAGPRCTTPRVFLLLGALRFCLKPGRARSRETQKERYRRRRRSAKGTRRREKRCSWRCASRRNARRRWRRVSRRRRAITKAQPNPQPQTLNSRRRRRRRKGLGLKPTWLQGMWNVVMRMRRTWRWRWRPGGRLRLRRTRRLRKQKKMRNPPRRFSRRHQNLRRSRLHDRVPI
mmetsp:Transcript_8802/g.29344  ORF Transcript_8802/g.29344 Transcript_8802/m.29344 type:complete len:224 (+) Transcript_8802:114-785(+)